MPVEFNIDYNGPIAYCTFRYPDGDRMLAVWTDDVAVDEDPGVPDTYKAKQTNNEFWLRRNVR